jgi:hypothetical protein
MSGHDAKECTPRTLLRVIVGRGVFSLRENLQIYLTWFHVRQSWWTKQQLAD